MTDTFKTINSASEGLYKEKGSKFLSFAIPVNNIEEIKEIIKDFKKKYFDARHVCYAYMLGHERIEYRSNDDGEPSGTAGRPILGQINSNGLTDILILVVRYFGGTLLGTSGLIKAYKDATSDAISNAQIVEKTVNAKVSIYFDYTIMNEVMKVVKELNPEVLQQTFDNQCFMKLSVRLADEALLLSKLENIPDIKIE